MIDQEFLYKIHRSVRDAKTPFDLTVDYLNYWADFTGLDIIKTRKVKSAREKYKTFKLSLDGRSFDNLGGDERSLAGSYEGTFCFIL